MEGAHEGPVAVVRERRDHQPLRVPYGLGADCSTLWASKIPPKSLRIGHVYEEFSELE